jgi:FtsZ-interacting cell division protein ZipA
MNNTVVLVLVVIVVALVAVGLWLYSQRRRSDELRERFGPEYDRAVHDYGASGKAERALRDRAERVEQLHIRALSPEESARYAAEWRSVQAQFVDDPRNAIGDADRLVAEVMQARGYPMADFEQRAADISVDHPDVVEHYRAAHGLAGRSAQGEVKTEDMRQAMVHYRHLFDDLIGTTESTPTTATQEVRR